MNVTDFLTHMGLWPKPRLSPAQLHRATTALTEARDEANQLAVELETIAGQDEDVFGSFATRARKSRFPEKQ